MDGKIPAELRLLFPLAPAMAVCAIALVVMRAPASGAPSETAMPSAIKTQLVMAAPAVPPCCQPMPSRFANAPKSEVKVLRVSRDGVDYDAGNLLISISCSFTDLSPEKPVVAMSDLGFVTRLQTDAGSVSDSRSGVGIINPAIQQFKNAEFVLQAKVPLVAKTVNILHGALTVQRARAQETLSWREPFAAEIGKVRKAGGFEITLTKFVVANDVAVAEWSCEIPPNAAERTGWNDGRGLIATIGTADKSVIASDKPLASGQKITRTFRMKKRVPATLDLSLITDLRTENALFELTNIVLDGSAPRKSAPVAGENF